MLVVALADAGIAMGGLGNDATLETADIVIQNDHPSKIPIAIEIEKEGRKIIMQILHSNFWILQARRYMIFPGVQKSQKLCDKWIL